jgi:hypothetical protein
MENHNAPHLIKNKLQNYGLSFKFSESQMKEINDMDNYPFAPKITIHFDQGGIVNIPRELNVTEFYFKAEVQQGFELAWGGK